MAATIDEAGRARQLWMEFEPIHAVTYFSEACRETFADAGYRGFWMGYFAGRSAPLFAAATPQVVTSTFFGFAPSMVLRSLPDAWSFAAPEVALEARAQGAAATLRQVVVDLDEHVRRALPLLESAGTADRDRLCAARGWSGDDWDHAADQLVQRHLLDDHHRPTDHATSLHARIEHLTDAAAAQPFLDGLTAEGRALLATVLKPIAIGARSVLWFPNPIGLPSGDH